MRWDFVDVVIGVVVGAGFGWVVVGVLWVVGDVVVEVVRVVVCGCGELQWSSGVYVDVVVVAVSCVRWCCAAGLDVDVDVGVGCVVVEVMGVVKVEEVGKVCVEVEQRGRRCGVVVGVEVAVDRVVVVPGVGVVVVVVVDVVGFEVVVVVVVGVEPEGV